MNLTARLAVKTRFLPDFPFDWSDTQPQRSRQSLTIDDFFPDKEESQKLQQRATHFLMGFLVDTFADLAHLQMFVPEIEPIHPAQKSEVVPMKVLFKDEKLKSETIDILSQLMSDANLDGTQLEVHAIYYMYTCRMTNVVFAQSPRCSVKLLYSQLHVTHLSLTIIMWLLSSPVN